MAGFRRFRSLNRCRGSLRHDAGNEAPGHGNRQPDRRAPDRRAPARRAPARRAPARGSGTGCANRCAAANQTRAIGPGPSDQGHRTRAIGHRTIGHRTIGHRTIGHRTRGQGHRVVRYVSILPGQAPPTCLTDNLGRIKNTRQGDSPAGLVDCIGKR